jgi:hypothetical protein
MKSKPLLMQQAERLGRSENYAATQL